MADPCVFIGYCWGSAGTTWLARALNAHFEIICVHAAHFPRFDRRNPRDVEEIIDGFLNLPALGSSYAAVGFTHGIQLGWHGDLAKKFGGKLRGFVLVRHPIKRVNSNAALNENMADKRTRDEQWQKDLKHDYDILSQLSGRKDFPSDHASLGFYRSCNALNRILRERESGLPMYRFEDLTASADGFNELVSYISDGQVHFEPEVVRRMQTTVIGGHSKEKMTVDEIFNAWTSQQREAYSILVKPEAIVVYKELGYDFPANV